MYLKIPDTDIFLVEDERGTLLFVPLKEELYMIDPESSAAIQNASSIDALEDEDLREFLSQLNVDASGLTHFRSEPIYRTTKLSIIPNNICNLKCSYCYSASGRNQSVIDSGKLISALDWFIDKQRVADRPLSIFITGGGEPLATWQVTSLAIDYARSRGSDEGLPLYISVITNGTLITPEKLEFLHIRDCKVGVSFDVLEDLQNLNRGEYGKVRAALDLLRHSGLRVMINTTVTPSSVGRMDEIVIEVIEKYPFVEQFTMEPVTAAGLFNSQKEIRAFYDRFHDGYIRAKYLAQEAGLNLRTTFDDSLRGISTRHCPGKFALTPSGKISICHLVSSPKEKRFDECVYGEISENGPVIDFGKFDELYGRNVFSYPECTDCIAKWSCGGECLARRATYPAGYLAEVCRFNRRMVIDNIMNYINL